MEKTNLNIIKTKNLTFTLMKNKQARLHTQQTFKIENKIDTLNPLHEQTTKQDFLQN